MSMVYVAFDIGTKEYFMFQELLKGSFREGKIERGEEEDRAIIFDENLSFEDFYILHSVLMMLFE